MPIGLVALVAVGVHAAADLVDDRLLSLLDGLDAWADGWLAKWETTAVWVDRIGPLQRTVAARFLAVAWELAVDVLVVLPQLGYGERDDVELSVRKDTWRTVLARLNQRPSPMRVVRPLVTAIFVGGGAYAIARLVEATLFVALQADVVPAGTAEVIARVASWVALVAVVSSHGWRAVLRALEHADAACEARVTRRLPVWSAGLWGSVLAAPLALALLLEAQNFLALVR